MKKSVKFMSAALALVLVAALSIGGTLAYLSDKDTVENTFTVGKIQISLDEAKTNEDGLLLDADGNIVEELEKSPRVQENEYKIVPGCKYHKDPTVHVEAGSEDCILYVTVENNLASVLVEGYIEAQIADYGWTLLTNADGDIIVNANGDPIYWRRAAASSDVQHFPVFTGIRTDMAADAKAMNEVDGQNILINAYAVQTAGWTVPVDPDAIVVRPVTDADLAAYVWGETFGAPAVD